MESYLRGKFSVHYSLIVTQKTPNDLPNDIYKSISILMVSGNSLFIYTYIMSVMVVARPSFGASLQT